MLVPTDIASALLIVVLVIPGFVYGMVRSTFRGPSGSQDTLLSSRIASAVIMSVIFDALYLIALGVLDPRVDLSRLNGDPGALLPREPYILGVVVLVLGFAVPALVSFVIHYRFDWRPVQVRWVPQWVHRPVRRGGYRNFPTAWDRAAPGLGGTFVRVRLADGKWIGGWYSSSSFVSTYPHARDLYIEQQHRMKSDGSFGDAVEGSSGVWLAIGDEDVVEWITSPFPAKREVEKP